ncbi:MAG: hypothetical protein KY464_02885 [Gemmatimonadetes bacterium]|nr:hypothetical protein [Gemmatimonadota bacterium]
MSGRSENDRLRRVEMEVESLLSDVRDQVQRLQTTVERMRALRAYGRSDPEHAFTERSDPAGRREPVESHGDHPAGFRDLR